VADLGEKRNTRIVVVGNSEGRQVCGNSRHRWEDNITMNLEQERGHQLGLSGSG
jgi:hypothetical protein